MKESTSSNLLNRIKNWQKGTSWLFRKRGGVSDNRTQVSYPGVTAEFDPVTYAGKPK